MYVLVLLAIYATPKTPDGVRIMQHREPAIVDLRAMEYVVAGIKMDAGDHPSIGQEVVRGEGKAVATEVRT